MIPTFDRKMIEEPYKLFAFGGAITPGGPSRWDVLDWDQRRTVAVIFDEEVREDEIAEGRTCSLSNRRI